MGGLAVDVHWERLVLPSVRGFIDSEDSLQHIIAGDNAKLARNVSYETLRLGMVGAIFLYHFAEVALERKALATIKPLAADKGAARHLISNATVAANGDPRPDDHKILGEVADAIKHAELNSPTILHVPKRNRVIEISHAAPSIFAEGLPTGVPQIVIATHAGTRSLSAIMGNVGRGWTNLLGLEPI
ncbi:hypothetical protein D3227_34790 [Mesorhizobium waimense]|uniref:Uncharacterized protein n=1 Tax=Mesorhizobium waimense TaxID=1300307 RepID=A0A3A5KB10_9HYPH|nr:hypothetical protein [Mesorhizobium waimense]RJT28150.1 hypothetical protein D3227_34790 [Mesorhizobium waimense]